MDLDLLPFVPAIRLIRIAEQFQPALGAGAGTLVQRLDMSHIVLRQPLIEQ